MISVLYVDDEPTLLEVGKIFLERKGEFSVDTISSVPEALTRLDTKKYDAIISDYQMPGIDGISFLKKVRNSGNTMPFILFSGRGREEVVIQALNEGADFYIQKGGEPLSQFMELANQVRQAVRQRQAQAGIRYLERREADILNFLPDATFAIDKSGMVISWNKAMEELTGIKSSEIIGKNNFEYGVVLYHERRPMLIDIILTPDAKFERERYLYTLHDNKMVTGEAVYQRPNCTTGYLWGKATRLFDESGNIVGAIESMRDISEHRVKEIELQNAYNQIASADVRLRTQFDELKHSQQKLLDNEENFKMFVETAPDALYISIGERFVYVNPAMIRLMGADSADQLLGMSVYDRVHPSFHQMVRQCIHKVITEHMPAGHMDIVCLKMDGTPIEVESSVATFQYQGKFAGLVFLRDITFRKQTENQLREKEEQYRRIVETTDEGIIQIDTNHDIVYVNRRMAEMHGCTPEEMIGKNISSFMVTDDVSANASRDQERRLGKSGRYERRYVTKEGAIRWMQISATALNDTDGSFRGSFAMCYDITDKKTSEIEIARKNADLEEAYKRLTAAEEELRQKYGELEQNQKLLEDSERKYRNVVEDQTEFICRFLPDGTHVFVNEAYCRYFGMTHDEIIGYRFRPKVPEDDRQRLAGFFAALNQAHPHGTVEYRIILPDGSVRWHRWGVRAIFDTSGTIIEYLSVGRDINDEMATKAALEESENRFRENYLNNPLAIFTWQRKNDDFVLVHCNKAAEILTGGKSKEYVGIRASDLYADRTEVMSDIRQCYYGHAIISKDILSENFLPGRHIRITAAYVPPDFIMVHMDDVTEHWLAEKALADNQRMLDALLHNLPGMVYRCRNDRDWTMEFVSDGCKKLTGYDPDDLVNNHLVSYGSLIVPEDRQHVYDDIRTGIENRQPFEIEYRILDKSGQLRWVWEQGRGVFNAQNEFVAIEGHIFNYTEHKETIEALSQANKKLNLLYSITRHDINNQLLALNGFTELLHEKAQDPALEYYFTWISQSIARISVMIRFTKEYEAIGVISPAWQDIYSVINTAIIQAPHGSIHVKNDLVAGTEVYADPMIVKVFYNLMDNTVRHAGTVTMIRFYLEIHNGDNVLVYEDDGAGIPVVDKENIFNRNFGKNSGLGLFIAREILSITGITIKETGVPGKGARFEMILPHGVYRLSGNP
ncbi:MAG TPA: PAS domain S-box protein [Methanoregula sp.]|nr:PAS domain S-box protein [Methanoregula sp.]